MTSYHTTLYTLKELRFFKKKKKKSNLIHNKAKSQRMGTLVEAKKQLLNL